MRKIFILFFILIFTGLSFAGVCNAKDYYLSPNGSDSGDGTIDNPWYSIDYALNRYANNGTDPRVGPGDTLYLRGGVYDVTRMSMVSAGGYNYDGPYIYPRLSGTSSEDATMTIRSYPGEWAIFDCGNFADNNSGNVFLAIKEPIYNVVFENFEVRYAKGVGLQFGDGHSAPFMRNCTFRNLYIHGCKDTEVNNNPAGLRLSGQNCIVEYCTFSDNGTTGTTHYNASNIIFYNYYDNTIGQPEPSNYARRNNVVRYCVFNGGATGFKDKEFSNFVNVSSPAKTNSSWANEIHHNIFKNQSGRAIWTAEDFLKIHHNLIIDGADGIVLGKTSRSGDSIFWNEVYNNTFVNMRLSAIYIEAEWATSENAPLYHIIKNNIIATGIDDSFRYWTGQNTYRGNVTDNYNIYDNYSYSTVGRRETDASSTLGTWRDNGYGANSVVGSVVFVDSQENDFRLSAGSSGKNSADNGGDAGAFDDTNWYSSAGYNSSDSGNIITLYPPKNVILTE